MSPKYEKVKHYHDAGLWSANTVRLAATKGWITQAECDLILSEGLPFTEPEPEEPGEE